MTSDKRQGILTDTDKQWLSGDHDGYDQKHVLTIAVAELMDDIKFLFDQDLDEISQPSTDSLSDLFARVDSHSDMDREECAQYLIALAYIITNEPIDYTDIVEDMMLHPRDESTSPNDPDRGPGSAMNPSQSVDELLQFRRALTDGIKIGKSRVESSDTDTIPDIILIDTNTELYKEPTHDRLKPDDKNLDEGFDTNDWRDALAKWLDAQSPRTDSSTISQQTALDMMAEEIQLNVLYHLSQRRIHSDQSTTPSELPYF